MADQPEIEWVGSWPKDVRLQLETFADALAAHKRGYPAVGRMVVVSSSDGAELEQWMKPDAFAAWLELAKQQPIVASGKTFVAHDGVVTAVISRFDRDALLFVGSHEMIEMADLRRHEDEDWIYPHEPRELLGVIFADEYCTERLREEIAEQLDWQFADVHDEMALVRLADQIQAAMPTPRYDPPWNDFWAHWQTMAKMWSLAAGRRRTSSKADQALQAWSGHPMIADEGWAPIERAVEQLYDQPDRKRNDFVAMAAERVSDPIERYGRDAWTMGLGPGPSFVR